MGNFHPLEVVDRGSETQLQVGEKFNYLIWRVNSIRSVKKPFSMMMIYHGDDLF